MTTDTVAAEPIYAAFSEQEQAWLQQNRDLLLARFGHMPKACLHVFGCQQNVSDGQRIEGLLQAMGFGFTEQPEEADLILFNTCAVREHAQERALGNVGAWKKWKAQRPERILILCGCMVQQEHVAQTVRQSYPYVSMVFGPHAINHLPQNMYAFLTGGKRVFDLPQDESAIREGLPVRRTGVKGWLPVMYGCNNFCTYCIVPYVRGREKSRRPQDVIAEAERMIAAGYKEITLLGQNVNSYGKTLDEPVSFAQLLRQINALPGDFMIRFMTSHPKDCTLELLQAMRDCDKVAKHLHLPVQCGSDRVLKAMNRGYTAEQYLSLVHTARELMPELSLTSDLIVGFPGETYEDFQQTLELVRRVGYSSLYTFIFSPRKGTPAEKLPDPVPAQEKSRWFQELLALQETLAAQQTAGLCGNTYRVLCEGQKKPGLCYGRTGGNVLVEFPGDAALVNTFVNVTVTEALSFVLKGTVSQ